MRKQSGFTLVEILIVVVILGILAAIVIPQFTEASTNAKTNSLRADLQTIRSQVELFKIQHNDELPGTHGDVNFAEAMTTYTNVAGTNSSVTQSPGTGRYGPYLQKIPANPFTGDPDVAEVAGTTGLGDAGTGWQINTITGLFSADDTTEHSDY